MPLLEVEDLNEQSMPPGHVVVSKSVEHPVGQEAGENKAQCADIGGYRGQVESKDEDDDGEENLDLNERSMSPDCVSVAKSSEYPLGQGANENKAEHADIGGHGDQLDNKDEDGVGEEVNEQGTSPDHVEVAKSAEHHMGQEVNENKSEHVDVGGQGDRVDNKVEDGDGEEHLDLNEQSTSPDNAPVAKSIKHPMGQEANENKAERPDVGGHGDQVHNKDEVEDEEEDLGLNEQITTPDHAAIAQGIEHPMGQVANENKAEHADVGGHGDHVDDKDDDEDEEVYVDFNPFLKETPSQEASSSFSSEIERLDADVADSGGYASAALLAESMAKAQTPVQDYPVGETDHDEEIVTQIANSSVEECMKDSQSGPLYENGDESGYQMNVDYCLVAGEPSNLAHFKKPLMNMDDGDAICMRTRARYSLARFTLDELETFLQETDEEDDLQNVLDDEAEYRKFLAAVLQGGDGDIQGTQDNENVDDEDEEIDADFELEIEETLESDNDEDARYEIQEDIYETAGRRPKTRQNRHQKASVGGNKKLLGQRPLRPLLPCVPIVQCPVLQIVDGTNVMRNHSLDFLPSISDGSTNGFTFHQIGQLHCLIHEHVQLLIQVFSICVLDPARRHIAAKVQELILEMLRVRENALAWKRLPYPSFCFFPPYIHPSAPNEIPTSSPEPCVNEAASVIDVRRNCLSGNKMVSTDMISPGNGRRESQHNGQTLEGHYWMPYINDPVFSVMDVAPLKLVANFLDDVSVVVQEYHRRLMGLTCDTSSEKDPLFPVNTSTAASVPGDTLSRDTDFPTSVTVHVSPNNNQLPKRTMASALVEKAKKRSVVLVPKEIAQLAWRFYPLFNAALYPHKPPLASVASRVLFTDAEDELLALGFMEYNTDWKAIEQRYLPCKSKHQIFVRQKNRSSSKAPENPIKAVRRMKNSPLTSEEIARIEEGMKIYRFDWMSIWKFAAPHRDPSLLHRQWRIATGTQKSYKVDADKLAKRRLYDLRRRNQKFAALANCHSSPDKEDNRADKDCEENSNGHNQMDREDEAYLHEVFLADWRPGTSKVSSAFPDLVLQSTPVQTPLREGSQIREQLPSTGSGDGQPSIPNELPVTLRSPNPLLRCRPYRARKATNARVVKLAPDLPPVNLPPSVRVMSQSAFKSYQTGATFRTCTSDVGPEAGNGVLDVAKCNANARVVYPVQARQVTRIPVNSGSGNKLAEDSIAMRRNKFVAERNDELDLQMHPLLFQAPDDGHFPYYPLRSSASSSSSFNFFAGSQPQLNLSLFHNPQNAAASIAVNFIGKSSKPKESTKSFQTDFHPLLQRSEGMDSSLEAHSAIQLSTNLEVSEGRCDRVKNPSLTTDKMSGLNISSTSASMRPISPSEKSNELDLDIHLSFTSRQHVAVGSRDASECVLELYQSQILQICAASNLKRPKIP